MVSDKKTRIIIAGELAGFCLVIACIWANELWDLPHRLLGSPATPVNWSECIFETLILACLGLYVMFVSWFLADALKARRQGPRVCPVCKKIKVGDEWVQAPPGTPVVSRTDAPHNLCPECFRKILQFL